MPTTPRPRSRLSTEAARAGGAGGQGGVSLATSLALHGAALATLVLAFEVPRPAGRDAAPVRAVEARLEPRAAAPAAPAVEPRRPDPVAAPALPEPEFDPLPVPEPAASAGASAGDSSGAPGGGAPAGQGLLTVTPGRGGAGRDPFGAQGAALPGPRERPRVLRPRALPPGTGNSPEESEGTAAPPAWPAPAAPDTSPRPLAGLCPDPDYPARAERLGWGGTVVLVLEVCAAGTVTSVRIESTSGHDVLDRAAVATVEGWRFRPARANGRPVAATVRKAFTFRAPGRR